MHSIYRLDKTRLKVWSTGQEFHIKMSETFPEQVRVTDDNGYLSTYRFNFFKENMSMHTICISAAGDLRRIFMIAAYSYTQVLDRRSWIPNPLLNILLLTRHFYSLNPISCHQNRPFPQNLLWTLVAETFIVNSWPQSMLTMLEV